MLLIYSHITSTWAADNGASWAAGADALTNRDPADAAVLSWPASTKTVHITTAFASGQYLGGLALLNTGLPATAQISVQGQATVGGSYSITLAAAQAVAPLPGGGNGIVLDFGASPPLVYGAQVTIEFPAAPSAGTYTIGSLVTGPAARPWIQTGWESGDTDPSTTRRTLGGAVQRAARPGYRTLTVTPVYDDHDAALGDGLAGISWQTLRAILRADPYVLAAPLTGSQSDLNTTAIYGVVTQLPRVATLPGPNYQPSQLAIEEVPGG